MNDILYWIPPPGNIVTPEHIPRDARLRTQEIFQKKYKWLESDRIIKFMERNPFNKIIEIRRRDLSPRIINIKEKKYNY